MCTASSETNMTCSQKFQKNYHTFKHPAKERIQGTSENESDSSFDEKCSPPSSHCSSDEDNMCNDSKPMDLEPESQPPGLLSEPCCHHETDMDIPDGSSSMQTDTSRQPCCLFPPVQPASSVTAFVLMFLFGWGTLLSLVGPLALPGGHIFSLLIVFVSCFVAGHLAPLILLPPLLGMLIMGFILRNVSYVNVAKDLNLQWSSDLRSMALVIILLRAGLGLDPEVLKRLSIVCIRLAFTPCLIESVCVAVASHYLLGFPWLWGFLLGFVLGAVSPAVVVPSMLAIQEKGLGMDKGIPVLIIAAASVDDVLAITGFGIVFGINFSQGNMAWTVAKGPLEALAGATYGVILGAILWFIPSPNEEKVAMYRSTLLLFGGLFALFASRVVGFNGAGALAVLTLSFVAGIKWRKQNDLALDTVRTVLASLWMIFQPLLFGLIGTEVILDRLDGKTIGFGLLVLVIGLTFRTVASSLVVWGARFSWYERLFISIAWLPKATVQAALGPVALDYARETGASDDVTYYATQVLTVAVLSILVTAPLGAAAIALSAPKLLNSKERELQDGIMEEAIGSPIDSAQPNHILPSTKL